MLLIKKKLWHLRFILDLSLSICSSYKVENLQGKSFSHKVSYGHSIDLVTKYHYVNSFTIYTVLAHSHLMQSSQELCKIVLILFILQKESSSGKFSPLLYLSYTANNVASS